MEYKFKDGSGFRAEYINGEIRIDEWNEGDHPRAENGRFTSKGEGMSTTSKVSKGNATPNLSDFGKEYKKVGNDPKKFDKFVDTMKKALKDAPDGTEMPDLFRGNTTMKKENGVWHTNQYDYDTNDDQDLQEMIEDYCRHYDEEEKYGY